MSGNKFCWTSASAMKRPQSTNAWLASCQPIASRLMLATIGQTQFTPHSAAMGDQLFSFDWGGEVIVVTETKAERLCCFRDLTGALTYLDGVLGVHQDDMAQPCSVVSASLTVRAR